MAYIRKFVNYILAIVTQTQDFSPKKSSNNNRSICVDHDDDFYKTGNWTRLINLHVDDKIKQ